MLRYLARRVGISLIITFVVVSLSFVLIRLMPGNPMEVLYQQLMTQNSGMTPPQAYAEIQFLYGIQPHQPLWQQYLSYIGGLLHGDFGRSILDPSLTVRHILQQGLPWTVFSIAFGLIIAFVLGVGSGTIMATLRKTVLGKLLTILSTVLSAVPVYIIALLLIWYLADIHPIFPAQGTYSANIKPGWSLAFIGSIFYHVALPTITYIVTAWGGWALGMKGCVVTNLGSDYVRSAESWGLTRGRIMQSYIGRNSMLPMVTSLALSVGGMIGGAVFIETLFNYTGVGYYMINAVTARDYPIMMGCFIVITLAVVFSNLVVDLCYPLIDPRVTRGWAKPAVSETPTDPAGQPQREDLVAGEAA